MFDGDDRSNARGEPGSAAAAPEFKDRHVLPQMCLEELDRAWTQPWRVRMQALPDRVANAVQEQPRVSQPEADHARIVQLNAITQCRLCGGLDSRVAFREANPFGPPFREALYNSALFPNLRFAPPTMAGGKERVFAHALALFRAHGLRGRLFDADAATDAS